MPPEDNQTPAPEPTKRPRRSRADMEKEFFDVFARWPRADRAAALKVLATLHEHLSGRQARRRVDEFTGRFASGRGLDPLSERNLSGGIGFTQREREEIWEAGSVPPVGCFGRNRKVPASILTVPGNQSVAPSGRARQSFADRDASLGPAGFLYRVFYTPRARA